MFDLWRDLALPLSCAGSLSAPQVCCTCSGSRSGLCRTNIGTKPGERNRDRRLRQSGLRLDLVQIPSHIRISVSRVRVARIRRILLVKPRESDGVKQVGTPVKPDS